MEGPIFLALLAGGYLLNNKKTHSVNTTVQPPMFDESRTSVYDVNNFRDAQRYEQQLVQQNFDQSLQPTSNKVSEHSGKDKTLQARTDLKEGFDASSFSELLGIDIGEDMFGSDDRGVTMTPYYSREPAQSDLGDSRNLSLAQGRDPRYEFGRTKREVERSSLTGGPQAYGNPFGMQDTGAAMEQDRYIPGMYRTDERAFEQERVPHIAEASDINRDVDLLYAQRNSIDNTRTLSNQKVSFGGKVLPGKGVDERGKIGQVFKHQPDKDYENTADKWLVTNGATVAKTLRPEHIIKETNRQHLHRQDMGPIFSSGEYGYKPGEKRPNVKESDKQQLESDTFRNLGAENNWNNDFNKESYVVYPNEREVTSERTYQGNINSVYSAQTSDLMDPVKTTLKETTLDPKNNGYATTVTTLPTERLQDDVRTNKKETLLFDHIGNGSSSVPQEMASDQYFRADLNPNKEIIAQGRYPTPESTKVTNGMDTINMDIQKIEDDYFNHRIMNPDKVYQEIPTEMECMYTSDKDRLDDSKISARIEGNLLDPFKENPYTQSLASFAY